MMRGVSRRTCVGILLVLGSAGLTALACVGDSETNTDAGTDAAAEATQDAAPDAVADVHDGAAPACNVNAPFGTPVPVSEINTDTDDYATDLSVDEKTMYFSSSTRDGGPGESDIWFASRANTTQPFAGIKLVNFVNNAFDDGNARISVDGLSLYFCSSRSGNFDMYVATRPSAAVDFNSVSPIAALNSGATDCAPFVSAGSSELWFYSNRTGEDLLYVSAITSGTFGTPAAVSSIHTASVTQETNPVVSADGLTLFFARFIKNDAAPMDPDIWVAKRATTADPFGTPTSVAELNTTTAWEQPEFLSQDGCRLYFNRRIVAPYSGTTWVAQRPLQ